MTVNDYDRRMLAAVESIAESLNELVKASRPTKSKPDFDLAHLTVADVEYAKMSGLDVEPRNGEGVREWGERIAATIGDGWTKVDPMTEEDTDSL